MNSTKRECLGLSCRFYTQKPDAICFKQGILPSCSPGLKAKRIQLDLSAPDLHKALKGWTDWWDKYGDVIDSLEEIGSPFLDETIEALAKAEVK